jgi:ABC-type Fe2+-enterobactin transport system substrate-binding protein
VAVEQRIEPLYSLDVDLEAVAAAAPDLIIGSAKGGDSSAEVYDQLSAIAPTVLLRYDDQTWQDVTTEIGAATGHEQGAQEAVDGFAEKLAAAAGQLVLPAGPVAALVFNGLSETSRFWTPESAQGALLTDAGFTLLQVPAELGSVQDGRADVVDVTVENLATALADAAAVVLFSGDETTVAEFAVAPTLSTSPAVASGAVVAAGLDSFRLDAYSAADVLDRLVTGFS